MGLHSLTTHAGVRAVALLLVRDGAHGAQAKQRHFMLDPSPVEFVRTGVEPARSLLFRWLVARRAAHRQA